MALGARDRYLPSGTSQGGENIFSRHRGQIGGDTGSLTAVVQHLQGNSPAGWLSSSPTATTATPTSCDASEHLPRVGVHRAPGARPGR